MPRGPDPSWEMKKAIWDLYGKLGPKPEVILRDLDRLCGQDKPLHGECPPDPRTIGRIIDDLQRLHPEVVRLLPPHVQVLRKDWPTIGPQLEQPPESALIIAMREVGSTVPIPEKRTSGKLVAFTLGNCAGGVLIVQGIYLEVLTSEAFDYAPGIGVRLIPYEYDVELKPAPGEYLITEDRFNLAGGDADDFNVVCTSPEGIKYIMRVKAYGSDLATKEQLVWHSESFDICFYKKGGRRRDILIEE